MRVRSLPALGTRLHVLPHPRASPSPSPAAESRGRVWEPFEGSHYNAASRTMNLALASAMTLPS